MITKHHHDRRLEDHLDETENDKSIQSMLDPEIVEVKVVNQSKHELPKISVFGSAGVDIRANLTSPVTIEPLKRCKIETGLFVEIPLGFEGQVRPRSGLAAKNGITVLNSPGTIDSSYRGEIIVILINLGEDPVTINDGERIAQLIIAPVSSVRWISVKSVSELSSTERGVGGFGHTGVA